MLRLSLLGALSPILLANSADAQEIIEIDMEAGRTVIDSEYRSLYSGLVAVDWTRGILYGSDREEPEGIMLFSLESGEWIRTIPTPRGDGPGEFSNGRQGMALAPEGGLYVSGYLRVAEFDASGELVRTWTPLRPPTRGVCNFGGTPAVPTQGGVVVRGPNREDQEVGPVVANGVVISAPESREQGRAIGLTLLNNTRITCSDDEAYVFTAYNNEPGTLFAYHRGGTTRELVIADEDARPGGCRRSRRSETECESSNGEGTANIGPAWRR